MNPQMMDAAVAQRILDIRRQAARPAWHLRGTSTPALGRPQRSGMDWIGTHWAAAPRSLAHWSGAPRSPPLRSATPQSLVPPSAVPQSPAHWSQVRRRLGFTLIAAGLRLVADGTAPQG